MISQITNKRRAYHQLGILLSVFCLICACAEFDEPVYDSVEDVRANERSSNLSQRQGMIPDTSMIEQMRTSRMASLNQSDGARMPGSARQTGQNKQQKENTQNLQSGIEAYNLGDYKGAINKLKQFVDQHPASDSTPEAIFHLGESHYRLKEYQKAMNYYKNIDSNFSLYPRAGEALYRVGKCL